MILYHGTTRENFKLKDGIYLTYSYEVAQMYAARNLSRGRGTVVMFEAPSVLPVVPLSSLVDTGEGNEWKALDAKRASVRKAMAKRGINAVTLQDVVDNPFQPCPPRLVGKEVKHRAVYVADVSCLTPLNLD